MKAGITDILRKLYLALIAGQFMFGGVVLFLLKEGSFTEIDFPVSTAWMIVGAYVPVTLAGSFFIFRSRLDRYRQQSLQVQLQQYRTSAIIRWAMLESGFFVPLIFSLIANRVELALPGLLPFMLFVITYPTTSRLADDLRCDWRDLEEAERKK